jgi:Cu/Ag efflux protein CusF
MTEDTIERQKRNMDIFSEPEKKLHVLTKFLAGKDLKFKNSPEKGRIVLKKISPDGNKVLVSADPITNLEINEKIVLFRILARFIQLECKVLQKKDGNDYVLAVERIGIANKDREAPRYPVPPGHVWITNILTSKATIDANMFIIPTSVKVNFSDYEIKLKNSCDFIRISVFKSDDSEKFHTVRKTQKILLIEDTQNINSYKTSQSPDFINYSEEVDSEIQKEMRDFKDHKIVSELIVPVSYLDLEEKAITIGYVHMQSKKDKFDLLKAMEVKTLTFEMVDRIRNSNTITITDRFPVIDISSGGLKVKINNPDLNTNLPRMTGFNFDIFFKMQSPMSVYGTIRSVTKDTDGSLIMGIHLAGHSSRPGEKKRFLENLELMKKSIAS